MTEFRQKICLVTGAASGIGRATAIALAREGAQLLLTDINSAGLADTAERITRNGGTVLLERALDISSAEQVARFATDIHALCGSVDVLLNVAGISTWGTVESLSLEDWRKQIEVNLMGPIHALHYFVPAMIAAGRGGHVVNVSSAAGLFGLPWHAAYSAAKFGLRGISEVLRFDLAHSGIGVSLVCPGAVNTGLVETVNLVGVPRDAPQVQAMTRRFQRHAVSPEQAARAILKGVRRNRYMIFTSPDVRIGYWFQRKFAWPYRLAMTLLNRQVQQLRQQLKDEH